MTKIISRIPLLSMMAMVLFGLQLTSCTGDDAPKEQEHEAYVIERFADNPYLGEVWWGDDYDTDYATEYYNNYYNHPSSAGGCSSWHKGHLHGRNFDWMMHDFALLIVHTPKSDKVKYASVRVLSGNDVLNKDFMDTNNTIPVDMRKYLPAGAVDGINECGVVINHNIVPYDGAEYEKNGETNSVIIIDLVLNNCATAKEAVELLKSKSVTMALVPLAHDYSHFMISDKNSTYVVEWTGKDFHATEFKSDGNGNYLSAKGTPAIMTNYFVWKAEEYGLGTKEFFLSHPEATGVERFWTIEKQLPQAQTVEDHLNICKSVWYKQFCQGKTDWATENAGFYGYYEEADMCWWTMDGENIHWVDSDNIYDAAKEMINSEDMQGYYNAFNNEGDQLSPTNEFWYTSHCVVYDQDALKGYLIMQEGMFSQKVIEFGI